MEKEESNEEQTNPTTECEKEEEPVEIKKEKFSIIEKCKEISKAIKQRTGINGLFVIIFLLICVFLVYIGVFETLITNMVGTIYPGICTIKALKKNENKKDWLTYWVIYGTFIIIDMFSAIIMKIIPFYFAFKILFLIWMFIPGSNGCHLVYNFIIFKFFKAIEDTVDFFFEEGKEFAQGIIKETKQKGANKMKQLAQGLKSTLKLSKKLDLSGNMSEAIKAVQEIENEKIKSNPYSGSEFASSVNFPQKEKKKIENKEEENDDDDPFKDIKEVETVIMKKQVKNTIQEEKNEEFEMSDEVKDEEKPQEEKEKPQEEKEKPQEEKEKTDEKKE